MIKGVTTSGFKFSIDPNVVNDMEFIELTAAARNDGLLLPDLIAKLIGDDQKKKMYEHIKKSNEGRVPVDAVTDELTDILDALNKNPKTKN